MKKNFLLALFATLITCLVAQAQEGNSAKTALDGQDIDNIATFFLGVETKKVFLGKDHAFVDLVVEEYEDHKLKSTEKIISNGVKEMVKMFGRSPLKKDAKNEFMRIYFKSNIEEKKTPEFFYSYLNFSAPYRFKGIILKNAESQTYPNIPSTIKTRTPFAALCGMKTDAAIDMPAGATTADFVKGCDWVAVLYLEPLEEK
jgi:hypothetical protein